MLTYEDFSTGLELLAKVYGNQHAIFTDTSGAIADIWFEFFSRFTRDKFMRMIKHYLSNCNYFPTAPAAISKLWDESGLERRPGENWQDFAALPSSEARQKEELSRLTPEELEANRRRLREILKDLIHKKSMPVPADF